MGIRRVSSTIIGGIVVAQYYIDVLPVLVLHEQVRKGRAVWDELSEFKVPPAQLDPNTGWIEACLPVP